MLWTDTLDETLGHFDLVLLHERFHGSLYTDRCFSKSNIVDHIRFKDLELESREIARRLKCELHTPVKLTDTVLGIQVHVCLLFDFFGVVSSRVVGNSDLDVTMTVIDEGHIAAFPDDQSDLVCLIGHRFHL